MLAAAPAAAKRLCRVFGFFHHLKILKCFCPPCTVGIRRSLAALENALRAIPISSIAPTARWVARAEGARQLGCTDGCCTAVSNSPPGAEAHSRVLRETQWNLTKEKPKTYHIFSIKKWGFVPALLESHSQDARYSCVSGGSGPQLQESR